MNNSNEIYINNKAKLNRELRDQARAIFAAVDDLLERHYSGKPQAVSLREDMRVLRDRILGGEV